MLEIVLLVHMVERLGRIAEITQERIPWNAHQAGVLAFDVGVVQAAVCQFHDDDQLAVDVLNPVQGKNERMADFLDPLQSLQFLLGVDGVDIEGLQVAVDKLDRLEQAARRLALPDFAETAAAQRFDQAVAGDRLRVWLP